MPLFTFDCPECDESFEELINMSQNLNEISCPDCGSENVEKRMSRVARSFRPSSFSSQASAPVCAPGGT